jgi:hexosaminidase
MGREARRVLALALLGAGRCLAESQAPAQPPLIPLPAEITPREGSFLVDRNAYLRVPDGDAEAHEAAAFLSSLISRTRALTVRTGRGAGPAITFERQAGFAPEGYQLEVAPTGVRIAATSGAGLFYGAVTFWQLMPVGQGEVRVPAQVIRDAPAYAWRGLLLDSARHFQSPAFVKRMIDWMAWHKLNVLHWHLTDDQGWRLEIKKYPRLMSVAAERVPATAGKRKPAVYRGYYTQAEVRDIVAYAKSRHILVVPEIDTPGHAQATVAAYPQLGSMTGPPPPVSSSWGVHTYLFNLEPSTLRFLEDVLDEVMALFPGPYIHVGGDEAVKDQWKASPLVQARARELGITDPEALQVWFTQQMGRYLAQHGRRLVGWDEILQPGLSSDAIVMSWRGVTGAHSAAIAGNDTVLSPWPTLYFDNRQSALPSEPPGRTRVVSLEDVYRFEPRDPTLNEAQQKHVLGLQANVWTEHIRTEDRVEWMTLPRAAAVAEVGWTKSERKDWSGFLQRLAPTMARYRAFGLHYADSVFAIDGRVSAEADGVHVSLANQASFGAIRYTTDAHDPTTQSSQYTAPLRLPLGTELRAATFFDDEVVSGVWRRKLDAESLARRSSRELDLCTDGVGLLLEPDAFGTAPRPLMAIDIMNPCWIYRGVDLTHGARLTAAAGKLPFNFEIGADAQKIRVGDARSAEGELEVRIDGCDGKPAAIQPLAPLPDDTLVMTLPAVTLPARAGRHDVCLRFARPRLDPMWALDWVEIRQ